MEKEELIKFLRENLEVSVSIDSDGDLNVALILCDEVISKDWTTLLNSE